MKEKRMEISLVIFFGDEFCLLINGDDGSLPNMHVQFVMIVLEILSDLTDFDTK